MSLTQEEIQEITTKKLERQALVYTLGQWLTPHKEEIVHAWTDRYFHCGTTTTSRLEGAHAVLKRWIGVPSKDLTRVWETIKLALDDQINEITINNRQKESSTLAGLLGQFYHQVLGKITHTGLYKLKEQYQLFKRQEREGDGLPCTQTFLASIGMPCWHIIKERLESNQRK